MEIRRGLPRLPHGGLPRLPPLRRGGRGGLTRGPGATSKSTVLMNNHQERAPFMATSHADHPPRTRRTNAERAAINRQNSKRSTGPKTDQGKSISKTNAIKHGLRIEALALPGEDADALRERLDEWNDFYRPATPGEAELIEMAVTASVQRRRSLRFLTAEQSDRVRSAARRWDQGPRGRGPSARQADGHRPRSRRRRPRPHRSRLPMADRALGASRRAARRPRGPLRRRRPARGAAAPGLRPRELRRRHRRPAHRADPPQALPRDPRRGDPPRPDRHPRGAALLDAAEGAATRGDRAAAGPPRLGRRPRARPRLARAGSPNISSR